MAEANDPLRATLQERTTDDRGIYRFYGLPTGLLMLAGVSRNGNFSSAYRNDAPTYSPSTRDTAAEIAVQAGEETTTWTSVIAVIKGTQFPVS